MLATDPFFLFCLSILFTPLIVRTAEGDQLELRPFDASVWLQYWTDPAVVAGLAFALPALWHAGRQPALPRSDEMAANWFLVNGAIIHVTMDGLTGGYQQLPLMSDNYRNLGAAHFTPRCTAHTAAQLHCS